MLDMVEKASGQLREMGFVADAQLIGNVHPPLPAELDETDTRIRRLERLNPAPEGSGDIGSRHDVKLRTVSLRKTLAQLQLRTAAPVTGSVCIVARFRLPVPPSR